MKQFIKDLKLGDSVNAPFAISDFSMQETKKQTKYIAVTLSDKTGSITARRWGARDNEDAVYSHAYVVGKVTEYDGKLQITIETAMIPFTPDNLDDFEACSDQSIVDLKARLEILIFGIEDLKIRHLLRILLGTGEMSCQFDTLPAAKSMHHAYKYGLLEHTCQVAELTKAKIDALQVMGWDKISRDIAIAGALLHDLGKVEEYEVVDGVIKVSPRYGRHGHICISYFHVRNAMDQIAGFPQEAYDGILHIIVSHHGKLEYGSPVAPMEVAAFIVAQSDRESAHIFRMIAVQKSAGVESYVYGKGMSTPVYVSQYAPDTSTVEPTATLEHSTFAAEIPTSASITDRDDAPTITEESDDPFNDLTLPPGVRPPPMEDDIKAAKEQPPLFGDDDLLSHAPAFAGVASMPLITPSDDDIDDPFADN